MSAPLEKFLAALRAYGYEPAKNGTGWKCKCPAHLDHTPSLAIGVGDDGRVLIHCFAGCPPEDIVKALGLTMRDLMSGSVTGVTVTATPHGSARLGVPVTVTEVTGRDPPTFATANEAVADLERRYGPKAAFWTYHDRAGDQVGVIVRWDLPPDPGTPGGKQNKRILPVSKIAGRWLNKGMPDPKPLYGLHELLKLSKGSLVLVVEGEKAADAARALGFVATTSPHGSQSARKADWSPLAGMHAIIVPDNDTAGEKFAQEVARLAMAAGALSVRIVRLPGLPEAGDIVEFVAARGGDVGAIRAEIQALADATAAESVKVASNSGNQAGAGLIYVPFPSYELPPTLWGFIEAAGKAVGCDEAYVALPVLAALGSAIGCTCRIQLKRSWSEPPIIWAVGIGKSGSTKSPGADHALYPVHERERLAMKEYDADMAAFEEDMAEYEQAKRSRKKGEDPPTKPKEPHARECWTTDATTEAVAPMLIYNARGILMAPDELATWINSFDRYAGGRCDGARWIQTFHGRPMKVNRKGDKKILYVPRAAVCVYGTIQPKVLTKALGEEHVESGLAARLLLAHPPTRVKKWTDADISHEVTEAYARVLHRLYALDFDRDLAGDLTPRIFTLSPDALELFKAFYNDHAIEQADLDDDALEAVWSKMEAYAARFALIIHLATWAEGTDAMPSPVVSAASMDRAIRLTRWFCHEARRVYGIFGESDADRQMRNLVAWIEGQEGEVTVRDLSHGKRAFRNKPEEAEKALEGLVAAGRGHWEYRPIGPKGGAPTKVFKLDTPVTDTTTPPHDPASGGNGDGDAGDGPSDGQGGGA